jgi:hypothetical protein
MAAHFTTIPDCGFLSRLLDSWRNIAISLIARHPANRCDFFNTHTCLQQLRVRCFIDLASRYFFAGWTCQV